MSMSRKILSLTISLLLHLLAGCSHTKNLIEKDLTANEMYQRGNDLFKKKEYKKAADQFEMIFFQYPGKEITIKAELMQIYALYLAGDYDSAIDISEVFIKLHPRHKDVIYAYYMKALSYYAQISSVKLDQSKTRYAKENFEQLIARFPGTKYATDSSLKLDLINDHLAGKEVNVGTYYLVKKNPIAALKRFQIVINKYQQTSHIKEALYRMVEANKMLGLDDEAKKYAAVLGYNFQSSKWYKRAHALLN